MRELESLDLDLQLLIVDDNSQNGNRELAQELSAVYKNITVIERPSKLGLGSALLAGLTAALATDARYLLTMDADRSHDPQDVPRLMAELTAGSGTALIPNSKPSSIDNCIKGVADASPDLVQASRYISGGGVTGMPSFRRISSRLAERWGWQRHKPSRWRRHFIKRFYGSYPAPLKPGRLIGA